VDVKEGSVNEALTVYAASAQQSSVQGGVGGDEGSASLVRREKDVEREQEQDRGREEWLRSVKWAWGVRGIVEGLWGQVKAEKAKNLLWSRKLKEVVEKEKALAAEEKREWARNKRREKRMARARGVGT